MAKGLYYRYNKWNRGCLKKSFCCFLNPSLALPIAIGRAREGFRKTKGGETVLIRQPPTI